MTESRPGIDHVVLAVRDLEAARRRFAAMGFTLTPPALHPFGTGNSLVQLQGNFIELLAVVEPHKLVPATEAAFSFGEHNRRFLERHEGLSMAVLTSDDAAADNARWAARGLRTYEPVHFARQAQQPDGGSAEVSFTIAFAVDPAMPEAAFFVCQQHAPEHFWRPDYQRHANGARRLVDIVMAAEDPAEHASFFRKLVGPGNVTRAGDNLDIALDGGRIEVLTPTAAVERFVEIEPAEELASAIGGPVFVAASVAVADLAVTKRCLHAAGIPAAARGHRLRVGPAHAFGMTLEFVADS